MSINAFELPAEGDLASAVHEAESSGEIIYLVRDGETVAAIVPGEEAQALERTGKIPLPRLRQNENETKDTSSIERVWAELQL